MEIGEINRDHIKAAKFPLDESSAWQSFHIAKFPRPEIYCVEMTGGEFSSVKLPVTIAVNQSS